MVPISGIIFYAIWIEKDWWKPVEEMIKPLWYAKIIHDMIKILG